MKNSDQNGFSLVEVLVALGILGIVMAGVAPSFIFHMKTISRNELRSAGIAAAQQVLDEIRTLDPATLPTSGSDTPETVVVNNKSFSVTTSYCQEPTFCLTTRTRHLNILVTYQDEEIYEIETVYTQLR